MKQRSSSVVKKKGTSPKVRTNILSDIIAEMKKVTWPTKKQTQNYTYLVIGISLSVAAFLGALDYLFTWGFKFFY